MHRLGSIIAVIYAKDTFSRAMAGGISLTGAVLSLKSHTEVPLSHLVWKRVQVL